MREWGGDELPQGLPWGRTGGSRLCQGTGVEEDSLDLKAIEGWGQGVPAPFLRSPNPSPSSLLAATPNPDSCFLSPGTVSKLFLTQVHATLGGTGGAAQAPAPTPTLQMSIFGNLSRE